VVAATLLAVAAPAAAQYGGGPNLFVDPVRIEVESQYDAFGNSCPAGSTVTLTIDGIAGIQGTTTTAANGIYLFDDLPAPPEFVPGTDYTYRAECAGGVATFVATAVCTGGHDPIAGSCDGGTNSVPGGSSTTTSSTLPGGSTTTTTPNGGGGLDGGGGPGTGSTDLAITGLSRFELSLQIGVTLVAAGLIFTLLARRRREPGAV
jgi:hypothetical protein